LYAKGLPSVSGHKFYREVINDKNELLINLYRVAKTRADELFTLIDSTLYSRAEYRKATEICKGREATDIEKAWAMYVNLNCSFANKAGAGWGYSKMSKNIAATWDNRKQRFVEQVNRLAKVHIECDDALAIIKRWDSPQTCFYCDPPYPDTSQGHYSGYSQEDFANLVNLIDRSKGSFVLSCYDNPAMSETNWVKHGFKASVSAGYSTSSRSRTVTNSTECVWVIDRSDTMPDKLKKIASTFT
jgi:DNA adenine methylase